MPKNDTPTEYQECVKLANHLRALQDEGKIVKFAHLVNEFKSKKGKRPDWALLRSMKAEGWTKGVPDYLIVTPKKTLFLEMKRVKRSKVSKEQQEWLEALDNTGVTVAIAYGFDNAKKFIEKNT